MNDVKVTIEVEVNPTEDQKKVETAIKNLFPEAVLEINVGDKKIFLVAKTEGKNGLTHFYFLLRRERILDAAHKFFHKAKRGNRLIFYLNKQVACAKHVSFCDPFKESPLGPIKVEIICDGLNALIDWLAPKTIRK